MFEHLHAAEPDKILALMALFRADERTDKVDLGVGVYRDAGGATPVMRAVAEAERRVVASQATKSYVGIAGDERFNRLMGDLSLGASIAPDRLATIQTPGGSGALRVLMEFARLANPGAVLWLPEPTWPNHVQIASAVGLRTARYPYVGTDGAPRFDAMRDALRHAARGDVVLIHGCCHNPTGLDLSLADWDAIASVLAESGAVPLIDLAYQGLGDGLEADAEGARKLTASSPEALIAVSASKNFGVYRDRVGAAIVAARDPQGAGVVRSQMCAVARTLYSMPPHHGAAVVAETLGDAALRAEWNAELEAMRRRMVDLRAGFTAALRRTTNSQRFDGLAAGKGMFARLALSPGEIERLRREYGVYVVGDGRINVAGLPGDRLDDVAARVVAVLA